MTNNELTIWRFLSIVEWEQTSVLEESIRVTNHLHHVRLSSWQRSVIAKHLSARRIGRGVYYSAGAYWRYIHEGFPE